MAVLLNLTSLSGGSYHIKGTFLKSPQGDIIIEVQQLVPRVGRETIRILLLSHDLKPWREKMCVVAELDDDYIAKMEDVLERYKQPYDPQQPVVCLDEKPVTLQAEVRPPSPAQPGREARRDNEYERCGTANVFCAVLAEGETRLAFPS